MRYSLYLYLLLVIAGSGAPGEFSAAFFNLREIDYLQQEIDSGRLTSDTEKAYRSLISWLLDTSASEHARGRSEALRDIAVGKIKIHELGFPRNASPPGIPGVSIVKHGCVSTPETSAWSSGYYWVVMQHLEQRYGQSAAEMLYPDFDFLPRHVTGTGEWRLAISVSLLSVITLLALNRFHVLRTGSMPPKIK